MWSKSVLVIGAYSYYKSYCSDNALPTAHLSLNVVLPIHYHLVRYACCIGVCASKTLLFRH